MGLTPNGWGPYFWATIHLSALGAPSMIDSVQASGFRSFYTALPWVIPCQSCSDHLKETLQKLPLTEEVMKSGTTLFEWTVALHNAVNRLLGKSEFSVEQARTFWMKVAENAYPPFRQDTVQPNHGSKIMGGIFLLLLLFGLTWFLFSKKGSRRRI